MCNYPGMYICAELLDEEFNLLSFRDAWRQTLQNNTIFDLLPKSDKTKLMKMRANKGRSWCISIGAFQTLVQAWGCENVHIQCNATDVDIINIYRKQLYRTVLSCW